MPPRLFISYSHDSPAYCDRVLALAQQLRLNGIAAELDQFHQDKLQHWPRWCAERMQEDSADFVLCLCSAEYKNRVEGQTAADVGRGVFWEGAFIYNQLYRHKGNRRFVPVLLDDAQQQHIPNVLEGYTWFRLQGLGLDDAGYAGLYRLLAGQSAIEGALWAAWLGCRRCRKGSG